MKKYFLLFTISFVIYIIHTIYTLQGVYGDGNGYYSYTNTLYFQNNLDFTQIYNHLSDFQGRKYIFSRIFWDQNYNPFTIGTSLTWLPSLAAISLINSLFNLGLGRFDLIYELGPGISGIIFILFGLFFLEKYLANYFSKKAVFWTIITLFFGTNVIYYTAFEPGLSHQPSFFIISLALWWSANFKKSLNNFILLGLVFGFLTIIRMSDVIFFIPILFAIKPTLKDLSFFAVGFLIGIIPQLINQYLMFGNPLINPYINGLNGGWDFDLTRIVKVLVSPMRGLVLWTPILFLGFWGLIKNQKYSFLISIILMLLLVSSWSAYLTAGFGHRMFFSALPFFAYGIAVILEKLSVRTILIITLICFGWNLLLLKNVYLHKDLFIQDSDFTYEEFITNMMKIN